MTKRELAQGGREGARAAADNVSIQALRRHLNCAVTGAINATCDCEEVEDYCRFRKCDV